MFNVRKILFLIFCLYFAQGFAGASSETLVLNPCPDCLPGDQTASEVRGLSLAACEQVINSEECRGVNPKHLRSCEEEEESNLAFGQRVLGCMKGTAIEGAIGLGVGVVLGKVIVGISALMSVPFLLPALGITAGGGAALYIYSEYDRAYQEVGEGEGSRAMRAMGQLLGNMGTGIYRLLLGNYECYSSEGRAWEVCGLLLGGVAGGGAALATVKKAAAKTRAAVGGQTNAIPGKVNITKKLLPGTSKEQRELLMKHINDMGFFEHFMLADFRRAGLTIPQVRKAYRQPGVSPRVRGHFEEADKQLQAVEEFLNSQTGQSLRSKLQLEGLSRMRNVQYGEWEVLLHSIRKTGLSLEDGLAVRKETLEGTIGDISLIDWKYMLNDAVGGVDDVISSVTQRTTFSGAAYKSLDEGAFFSYLKRREAFEKATGHRLTTDQINNLQVLQTSNWGEAKWVHDWHVKRIMENGLSPEDFRKLVDHKLISTDEAINKKVLSHITEYENTYLKKP